MARADAAQAARENLPGIREKAAERAVILVVDEANAGLAKRATLLWSAHAIPRRRRRPTQPCECGRPPALPRSAAAPRPRARAASPGNGPRRRRGAARARIPAIPKARPHSER